MDEPIRTGSGRALDELTIDALRAGRLAAEDFRISRAQLDAQADAAEAGGYRQLAEKSQSHSEFTCQVTVAGSGAVDGFTFQ